MSPTRIRYRLAGVAVATLAVAAVTPVVPVSAAPSATVSPGTVAPGGRVSLNVEGCGTKTGRATSRAFGNVTLTPGNLEATNLFGAATVYRDAPTGSHPVTFECGGTGGRRITVTLQVAPGAARGGLGGSVESMSTGQVALGGTLAASALCAGIWILRRRTARTG
ncbi:hypothetical protein ACFZBM_16315 [Streptomyces lavendulae]|uniref:Uncharacterized protein n=1 Tax=Streptomyces lavendulae subsp. lavendulae TaxID=58340 RepID=A0A2K8PLC1_STRLA|nr:MULTISPECIES: hypothetical protein [Streptomyces]ATZ26890.1 hypothetical protein SLAV_25485 [Streptomyces lavendulae subsp. lavendulae]MDH6542023.1 hypothetical protein [Streptomyces sp. SPB4]QUQ56717.1 hypothetical protein SLLC_23615 [Streptomyces lavendulae subsp. lavendulae]GLV97214.1 hypothetical protein Slala05_08460 [Streptomyces lavendulae subsp. lavendulae]